MASFFKPASQKEHEKLTWRIVNNSLVVGRNDADNLISGVRSDPTRIAAFDLDDTLITATGNKWDRSSTSWKWWDPCVPARLRSLRSEGYLVTILTNQGNISLKDNPKIGSKDSLSLGNFKKQLASICQKLDFPITVYAATGQDQYRKPRIGMWQQVLADHHLHQDSNVDMLGSFYVGDAAGREKTGLRRKDHATSDR